MPESFGENDKGEANFFGGAEAGQQFRCIRIEIYFGGYVRTLGANPFEERRIGYHGKDGRTVLSTLWNYGVGGSWPSWESAH